MKSIIRFILHYLLSTFTYGIFSIPLILIAIVSGTTLTSTLTIQDPTNIQNAITYTENHNFEQIFTYMFFITTLLFNFLIKTRLLIWLTKNVKIILLNITVLFIVTYIISYFKAVHTGNDLWQIWLALYVATILTTLFGLFVTKISLLVHQFIDKIDFKVQIKNL